jgi:uncharacterized protein (TIGR02646 family)
MIRIQKSAAIPKVLVDKGIPATDENCRLYLTNPAGYDTGKPKFNILSTIYGDASVKQQLTAEQHGKCCFCEADFSANAYGDVEHFRPKAGFTKTRGGTLIRPGYYWLAYEWSNLFFSCQICNQRFKKNHFPLEDETKRSKNHTFEYHEESPLLLHPSIDNPEDYITFNRHVPKPVAKSERGVLSISSYGIDRPALNRIREAYLQNVENNMALAGVNLTTITDVESQQLAEIMNQPWLVLRELILKAKEFIAVATTDYQPFAAMVRANFPNLI